jgi:beta-1,4-mannooligosaccharide/beta-1,4-mannosyl-N-acetylglucosamine phosphorylase
MQFSSASIIQRHPANPILTHQQVPYPATLVFNAGVCKYLNRYAMVFRNDYGRWGDTRFDGTNLGLAFSDDGIRWEVQPEPCISLETAWRLVADLIPRLDPSHEVLRFYDPRLTVIEERVHMCFAVDTRHGLRGGIAVTDDFARWEVRSLSLPDNRNMVLFPDKIGGRYARLERPMLGYFLRSSRYDVWTSSSPDLEDWGGHRLVLEAERVPFSNDKIGPGAPPVRTAKGWLTTFHAVDVDPSRGKNGWETSWKKRYTAGVMLLDLDDPSRIIGLCPTPLIAPEAPYEKDGFRNDVIFPGGMILEPDGQVKIYYGAADTVECLATAHVDDLLRLCGA